MNAALIRKLARDSLPLYAITLVGVLLLETLIVGVFNELAADMQKVLLGAAFIRRFVTAIMGAELGEQISPTGMMAFGFAHPVLYALIWSYLLTTITRVLVGEIERGTADLLLTLPISRMTVYCSATVVWLAGLIVLSAAPLVGTYVGQDLFGVEMRGDFARLARVTVNLFALLVAIGGVVMLVSSWVSRRGMAIGIVLGLLLGSFLLNFLALFSDVARRVSALGVLHYYRPLLVVRDSGWPTRDIGILVGLGAICWTLGAWRYTTRDIRAA